MKTGLKEIVKFFLFILFLLILIMFEIFINIWWKEYNIKRASGLIKYIYIYIGLLTGLFNGFSHVKQ